MIAFWVVAGVLTAAVAGLIFARAAGAARLSQAADPTAAVYKRQLAEIDEMAERGLIAESERKSAHAEAARRLLAAAETPETAWGADPSARQPVLIAVLLAAAAALGLYFAVGSPGLPDRPFAQRLAEWRQTDPRSLAPAELASVLQQVTRERPDPEGLRFLAIAEGAAQNPAGAVRAMRKAVRLAPQRADLWETLGEALVFENGGEVSGEAVRAFRRAVELDPRSVAARFHLARFDVVSGDRAAGVRAWQALLAELPAGDPRRQTLSEAIAEAQGQGAAERFTPEQLTAIRGMVEGLSQRLHDNPDDAEGWVRLVRAYAVLGDQKRRDDALTQAKARFSGRKDIVDQLEAAAQAEPMQ
jgi:cytochrome c-type biogenesis protein CcmH